MVPDPMWEYKEIPWVHLLCVKIYRRHQQLAPNVLEVQNDILNIPEGRASIKRRAAEARQEEYDKKKKALEEKEKENRGYSVVKIKQEGGVLGAASTTTVSSSMKAQKQQVRIGSWATQNMTKAMIESSNVNKKLSELDYIERQLAILDRVKGHITAEDYSSRVQGIVKYLPQVQNTFLVKDCEVININKDEEDQAVDGEQHDEDDVSN